MPLRPPVVLDTTVLSNYAASESTGYLVPLLGHPVTVPSVRTELECGWDHGHAFLAAALDTVGTGIEIVAESDDGEPHSDFRERLDRGEADALSAAIGRTGTLATDDAAARDVAEDHGVPVTGSVGLLVLGVHREHISVETANEWLKTWQTERGYYAPVSDVGELL
jgi:predicted nucleic acid-binding protein